MTSDALPAFSPALRSYNRVWRLLRPLLPLVLKLRAWRGKEDSARLAERFGHYADRVTTQGAIWLHAVSVGETVAALSLAEAIAANEKDAHFIITTNTVTAAALVERATADSNLAIQHIYQPLDHPVFVDRFLDQWKPARAVFLESDFWPNLITRTAAKSISVTFASAQLSDRAMARWQRRSALAIAMFSCADCALTVSNEQTANLTRLGVTPDRITTLGSLKMSVAAMPLDEALITALRDRARGRRIFLAASTHQGEDAAVIAAAHALGEGWLTIIAPRHPNRADAIAAACDAAGMPAQQRSKDALPAADDALYIMDSLGEMGSLFRLADTVFLAGSLTPVGGHNPLEPASFGAPIISGPHVFKNKAEFDGLRAIGAVFDIAQPDELADMVIASIAARDTGRFDARAAQKYVHEAGKRQQIAANYILALTSQHRP